MLRLSTQFGKVLCFSCAVRAALGGEYIGMEDQEEPADVQCSKCYCDIDTTNTFPAPEQQEPELSTQSLRIHGVPQEGHQYYPSHTDLLADRKASRKGAILVLTITDHEGTPSQFGSVSVELSWRAVMMLRGWLTPVEVCSTCKRRNKVLCTLREQHEHHDVPVSGYAHCPGRADESENR
ncbi:hypothetical protein LCGC14_0529300 [marine sediment metagenome]|uniref:Uncharacterized protein n=1 Tax=marine sediment metagenome TaxID=412755 RepID=A0A0F9UHL3_9ZZZZ